MITVPIDIFEYDDYRAFLRDYYAAKKREGRGFSFRYFARRAGLGAPNHLKRVMDGDRGLAPATAHLYCHALGLQGAAASYFVVMVLRDRARSDAARQLAQARLQDLRRQHSRKVA